ncbi:MAG: DUF5522 domain-containing protein [Bacteroidota bacterium]|jgi:hypothetical protein
MLQNLEPEDFYKSDDGYIIFTEKYLLKRGYCCKSGCKHCPYGYCKKTDRFITSNDSTKKQNDNEKN